MVQLCVGIARCFVDFLLAMFMICPLLRLKAGCFVTWFFAGLGSYLVNLGLQHELLHFASCAISALL